MHSYWCQCSSKWIDLVGKVLIHYLAVRICKHPCEDLTKSLQLHATAANQQNQTTNQPSPINHQWLSFKQKAKYKIHQVIASTFGESKWSLCTCLSLSLNAPVVIYHVLPWVQLTTCFQISLQSISLWLAGCTQLLFWFATNRMVDLFSKGYRTDRHTDCSNWGRNSPVTWRNAQGNHRFFFMTPLLCMYPNTLGFALLKITNKSEITSKSDLCAPLNHSEERQ